MIPKQIDTHMKDSLREAIGILFPLANSSDSLISRHNWRTRKVLGEVDGSTVIWRGWSASIAEIKNAYRTLYIDYVPNVLPVEERYRLFGNEFAEAIHALENFVTMFVTSFRPYHQPIIRSSGFVCRAIGPNRHACKIVEPNDFVSQSAFFWAGYMAKLANLQIAAHEIGLRGEANSLSNDNSAITWANLAWEDENGLLDI